MIDAKAIVEEEQLEDLLSQPYPEDIEFAGEAFHDDVMVIGAGGKMGPTLVQRLVRSIKAAGVKGQVLAVSRFSDASQAECLERHGARCIAADVLNEEHLSSLPQCPYIIYMVGMKFGSTGNQPMTWAVNTYLPGRVAEHFSSSRIVSFSTGNVYPLVPVESGGPTEDAPTGPVGEYAQSCLGRERILQYFCEANSTPNCILRLNYAVEPRYGVLLDIAHKIQHDQPVPVEMGYVNVIWQGDANSVCLRAFSICEVPAKILNLTGSEVVSVRWLAEELGQRLGKKVVFRGQENDTALLNDASQCRRLFAVPRVSINEILDLVAHWVEIGGPVLDKPTKFEVRDGKF